MKRNREAECAKAIRQVPILEDKIRELKWELERREAHFDMKDKILKRMCEQYHTTGKATQFDIEAIEAMISTRPERWRDVKVEIGHG